MSLFQAREWWSAKPDDVEETGHGNLVVANIDNDPNGHAKIVSASYQGFLRIYFPRQAGYKIEDLMLEKNLELPVLQIAAGRFLPTPNKLGLAVLHPRKLVVYSVQAMKGQGSADTRYYQLTTVFEQKLDRTSFNLCFGPFGGVEGKDYICVQSMDGQLQVFENGHLSFSRYLNNFLVPGPLAYVSKLDAFVTSNSAMHVECYKYQVLSTASSEKGGEAKDNHGMSSSKRVHSEWSVNLGEHAIELFCVRVSESLKDKQSDIVVLGENTLFFLKENGAIRTQKRLDYNGSTFTAFPSGDTPELCNLLVSSCQNSLMVYKDSRLVWAARTLASAVGIGVAKFGGVAGLIVTLSDTNQVAVNYLGTDPPQQGASAADSKELDYEAMDVEHRKLLQVIKQANTDTLAEPSDALTVTARVPKALDTGFDRSSWEDETDHAKHDNGKYVSVVVKLFIAYSGREQLEDVHISLQCSEAFHLQSHSIVIPQLRGGGNRTPWTEDVRFRVSRSALPGSLDVNVVAAFSTRKGEPRTAETKFRLPAALACRVVTPLKNCQYMFTLDTNRSPPSLETLFEDILETAAAANADIKRTAANVMTVLFWGKEVDVTILVSKKSGRYRLQSGCFEALALVSDDLCHRLKAMFGSSGDFAITFKELLPLHDYFTLLDQHHLARTKVRDLKESLENQAHQFRVVQKRLLVRFKDKNPAPLGGLDVLFHDTYNGLIDLGGEMAVAKVDLAAAANLLSCATSLMLLLIRSKYELSDQDADELSCYLSPHINDTDDQGWEERTDASMTHLLRTCLAKNARDAANVATPIVFNKDTTKLKRHIQIVCDRLGKGLRIASGESSGKALLRGSGSPPSAQLPDLPPVPPTQDS
mmetsp:Transcript_13770/g.26699  ORF Transcript_13770/g.26699 Transcript_13770/m.26699 type:complete len:870 (-) Transcript_13770:352-2961(-)|eukprot:CAMPEP_0175151774 /NCGR_PEP_ID=MMETSP0087-20121206/18714_1 /TAXON_ID=136419 /ORGANISM="Unknown Unknown, Strain D1" /LENGTH=869 /DNA_ID=CAMNT_0016438071 /DNA_START=42 /DNA_END=2651 /DNA_ORIENTATION=+